jgi:hypothetical protein
LCGGNELLENDYRLGVVVGVEELLDELEEPDHYVLLVFDEFVEMAEECVPDEDEPGYLVVLREDEVELSVAEVHRVYVVLSGDGGCLRDVPPHEVHEGAERAEDEGGLILRAEELAEPRGRAHPLECVEEEALELHTIVIEPYDRRRENVVEDSDDLIESLHIGHCAVAIREDVEHSFEPPHVRVEWQKVVAGGGGNGGIGLGKEADVPPGADDIPVD